MLSYIMLKFILLYILIGGFNPSENMKVSLGFYSQYMESHKIHVPNHQPVYIYI